MRLFFLYCLLFIFQIAYPQTKSLAVSHIPEELKKNADAVVRVAETRIELESIKNLRTTYKKIVTVLNENGNKHIGAYVGYDNGINVKKLVARIYDKNGYETKKIKKSDFIDVSAVSSFSLYEDNRVKYLAYTPVEYPYTVEFFYEKTTENTAWIPFWTPLDGYRVSTQKSTFEILYTSEVGILKMEKNFTSHIKNFSRKGLISYSAENLKPVKFESLSPSLSNITPKLMVAPKNFYYEGYTGSTGNWDTLGKWMYKKLLSNRTELSENTKQKIIDLVSGINDPIAKAKKVYRYVQENTRYISVQEGIGGIQPISAAEVDRLKYGDCKGLTNYTKALLDVVGVKSNYTRVYASPTEQQNVNKSFPTFLGQTNHVILNIPLESQESVWLECTSQTSPFGFLGSFTDNRDVFVVAEEGGKVITTPSYFNESNYKNTTASYAIDQLGNLSGKIDIITKGIQYDYHFNKLDNESKEQIEGYYKNYWDNINNVNIAKYSLSNDRENIIFNEEVEISASKYASMTNDKIIFVANAFNNNQNIPIRYRDRKLPFEITRGFLHEDEFVIQLPVAFEVDALPDNYANTNKFGEYSISFSESNGRIILKRKLFVKKGKYVNTDYRAYRNFRKEISKNDNSQIVLKKITK